MSIRSFTDQMGNQVQIGSDIKRIVSLVPSQTHFLYTLGLENQIVGRTKFCIHPSDKVKQAQIIGGTKSLKINKILDLKPDIIIGNKEENVKEEILELQKHFPVWMSDVNTLDDACDMMLELGKILNKQEESELDVSNIRLDFSKLPVFKGEKVLYLIWKNPYMGVGAQTFVSHILGLIGLENTLIEQNRYPELTEKQIISLNPDYVFLSSEPYPFKEKEKLELQKLLPNSSIILVNGEYFSWYGSKLLQAKDYFLELSNNISATS